MVNCVEALNTKGPRAVMAELPDKPDNKEPLEPGRSLIYLSKITTYGYVPWYMFVFIVAYCLYTLADMFLRNH